MSKDNLQPHSAGDRLSAGYNNQSNDEPNFDAYRFTNCSSKSLEPNTVSKFDGDLYAVGKAFQSNGAGSELDFALLDFAFAEVEPPQQRGSGDIVAEPPDEPVNPHIDLSQYDKATQELIKKDGRGEPLTREERVKLDSLSLASPVERDLYQKLMMGKITREEKAAYIGIQEFNPAFDDNPEPSELVKKEVLGTLSKDETAKLHAYREFRYDNQDRQRELATKEFLKTATPAEQAELNSWREFPLAKFGRARDLVVKEQTTGLTKAEKAELALEREKPRIPIHGAFSIVAEGDNPKPAFSIVAEGDNPKPAFSIVAEGDDPKPAPDVNGPRSARVKELAMREFPDNRQAQDLVIKYMNGKLTPAESAALGALRDFPDEPIPRKLQEKELMGTIKPVEKAYLNACREFPSHLPNAADARRLAALETNDSISAHDAALLAGHREFSGSYIGLNVPIPKDAVSLAAKEREGTIGGADAQRLSQVRAEYKASCDKAMQDSTPPPPPPEPEPPRMLNQPQPPARRK